MLKNIITTILVAALVSVLILSLNKGAPSMPTTDTTLGSQIETVRVTLGGGVKIGGNGTIVLQRLTGTCTLIGTSASQTASTTAPYDCAIPNVKSGDLITSALFGQATSLASGSNPGWIIIGAKASTTAGYVTFMVSNQNGTARSLVASSGIASTTVYDISRTQSY